MLSYADLVRAWKELKLKSFYLSDAESERLLEELINIIKKNKEV